MALNGFAVYITDYIDNRTYELPINPKEIKFKWETDDKSETVINLGEINHIGNKKLSSVQIDSTFPKNYVPWLTSRWFNNPEFYINKFEEIRARKGHVQLVVGSTPISMTATISSFEYGFENGYDGEYTYSLTLKEYRETKYRKIKVPIPPKPRPAPPKKLGIGSIVICNGRLHLDSYGSGPGVFEHNARRQITYMAPGRAFPIHVALVGGGPRGWVRQSEVRPV
ncbi:hypothetical protein [Lactobacillus sp. PV034]|uniref:hypothetical protein n=1 Tax=Lactobacillus sp. PV034 TaxID=2594495 RepID=UPI0022401FCF|nr:hypothetical protein [Lactobacillus sp. PV034]